MLTMSPAGHTPSPAALARRGGAATARPWHRSPSPWLSRVAAPVLAPTTALFALVAFTLMVFLPPTAHADGPPGPVRMVVATAGLTWEDISAAQTPALQCLADHAGLGAMNTTSTTRVSTQDQGLETLHTGYRGLAETAPRSAGIPNPPTDQWAQIPGGVEQIDATAAVPVDHLRSALAGDGLVFVDIGALPVAGTADRADALQALDERVDQVLEAAGGCDHAALPRTVLLSVAATGPSVDAAAQAVSSVPSRTAGLQVAMDTAFPGQVLVSGSTKQDGLVVLTDVLPTILDSHDAEASGLIPGQAFDGAQSSDPQQQVIDRTLAARLVDPATPLALGSWLLLGAVGAVLVLVPPLARRPRVLRLGRALLVMAPLALPVGLVAQVAPWWRTEHPALALTAWVWAGSAVLSAAVLLGPWRRSMVGPAGASAALVAGIVLLESATGSHLQVASPLGAQPISGGRYYGLSNHLFGLVLGAVLMGLLCLFATVASRRARVLITLAAGIIVAGVCVAPSMGADFGSMLVTLPTFGLMALLLSGRRVAPWQIATLGAAAVAVVLAVSVLDWLRPPQQRTHLGRFIDDLLGGELTTVVIRKLAQNLSMPLDFPVLIPVLVAALALSVAVLMPRRLRLRRLAALEAAHPVARPVLIALVAGAWLGYAVNDTGPVLVGAVLVVWALWLPAILPAPSALPHAKAAPTSADAGAAGGGR